MKCSSMIRIPAFLAVFALAGCWTVREAALPQAVIGSLPAGKEFKVQLVGFDASFTTYDVAYGYTTVNHVGAPYYDRHGHYRRRLGTTTYSTTEYIPRTEATSAYRDRAADALERAGCILQTTDPQYRVEVRFDGPYAESGDDWALLGWIVCTAFTADFGAQNWSARVKVHDLSSGKLVLQQDLSVRDEAVVWGPIPIFSPACSTRTSVNVLKDNCLTALTDLAVAEVVAFFAGR